MSVPFRRACELYNIIGDGNCFFRALSLFLFGSQGNHEYLRLQASTALLIMVEYMEKFPGRMRWPVDCLLADASLGYRKEATHIDVLYGVAELALKACMPGVYVGQTIISVLSLLWDIDIIVLNPGVSHDSIIYC